MFSAFTPGSRFDNSIVRLIGIVYCPNTMSSYIFCVHRKTFQSLSRRDYQCSPGESMCHLRNSPFEERTISFFLKFVQRISIFEDIKKSIQDVIGDVFCPPYSNKNRVHLSTNKISSSYDCKKCKACSHVLDMLLRTENRQVCCLVVMVHIVL